MKRWIHAATVVPLGNEYELREENNQWYVFLQGDGIQVAGPFDSIEDAKDSVNGLNTHANLNDDLAQNEIRHYKLQHDKCLTRFEAYCKGIPGLFYNNERQMCCRSEKPLRERLIRFENKNEDMVGYLHIRRGNDSQGDYYFVY